MNHNNGQTARRMTPIIKPLDEVGPSIPATVPFNLAVRRADSSHGSPNPTHLHSPEELRGLLSEVRVLLANLSAQKIELERQNEELRFANSALENSHARDLDLLEMTGQMASVGGWELDLVNNQLFWTKETCRIHELDGFETPSLEQAIEFYSPQARPIIRAAIEAAIAHGRPWDLELQMVTQKGRTIWVRAQGGVVYESGRAIKLHGAFQDITDRKQAELSKMMLEANLRESQKMEAIGTLAGGVAHDFNNILAAIMGNTEVALLSVDRQEVTTRCLREIAKASERGRDLVRQILSFGRRRAAEQKVISIAPVVEESIQLLRAMLPARVAMTMECIGDPPKMLVDATHISQIVINLATNAYQAMAGKPGNIHIAIDAVPLDNSLRKVHSQLDAWPKQVERALRLIVVDNGPGMSEQIASRLFEPFFTTKPVGEGTGLGLAVVHDIVRSYQGAIMVESKPNQGAKFSIYFPVSLNESIAQGNANTDSEPVDTRATGASNLRVLYIDDDPAVLQSITHLLQHQGFIVEGFTDQYVAIEALRRNVRGFDIVVSDYNMPRITGIEFAMMVRALRTDLPIVIITGLIDEVLQSEAARLGIQELVTKPFSLKNFSATLQRVAAQATSLNP